MTTEATFRPIKGDAPSGPRLGLRTPRGGQHSTHGLAGAPDAGELGEADLHGLFVVASRDFRDGERARAAEQVHGVELVGLGCERVGDVE